MTFVKGRSGNPGGRPKVIGEVQELARSHTADAVTTLAEIIAAVDLDRNRFGAIWAAWDRRNDIVNLTGETKAPRSNLAIPCRGPAHRGKWIPVMIDLEGRKRGKQDGLKTVDRLAGFGVDL